MPFKGLEGVAHFSHGPSLTGHQGLQATSCVPGGASAHCEACVWQFSHTAITWKENSCLSLLSTRNVSSRGSPLSRRQKRSCPGNTGHPVYWENVRTVASNGKLCSVSCLWNFFCLKFFRVSLKGPWVVISENRDDGTVLIKPLAKCGPCTKTSSCFFQYQVPKRCPTISNLWLSCNFQKEMCRVKFRDIRTIFFFKENSMVNWILLETI